MVDHARFSLLWINDPTTHQRPMSTCRMVLRDAGGDAVGQSPGGLSCGSLFLDQVLVEFRPATDIEPSEYQQGDTVDRDWLGPTTELYVRTSPGRRSVCYTLGANEIVQSTDGTVQPRASLVYTTALSLLPDASGSANQRVYRPLRDLPVATHLQNVSEINVDLLWPLLQADRTTHPTWFVPNYRIQRVLCDFTARV